MSIATKCPRTRPDRQRLGENATFIFADVAAFAVRTEAHGDEPAGDLVERFAAGVR